MRMAFPPGSLLATLSGEGAPIELRRAARRLRAEAAPALLVEADIAALAAGLAAADIAFSPAVPDGLPPLFWVEAGAMGWIVERKGRGLAARRFAFGAGASPEMEGAETLAFPGTAQAEAAPALRGLVAVVSLPGLLAQMGEASPILLMPAVATAEEAPLLKGLRLSVAISPESAPQ